MQRTKPQAESVNRSARPCGSAFNAALSAALLAALAACGGGEEEPSTPQASSTSTATSSSSVSIVTSVPAPYYASQEKIDVLNKLNDDRARCGFGKLAQNAKLDVAAQGHADYLALNNANTHYQTAGNPGFTGIAPGDRISAAGYVWSYTGEAIGTTYYGSAFDGKPPSGGIPQYSVTPLSVTNTLRLLYSTVYHLSSLMAGNRDVGVGVSTVDTSNPDGTTTIKRLVINTGVDTGSVRQAIAADGLISFPCDGTTGTNPYFGTELPDPFPTGPDRTMNPYGQPVYLTSGPGTTLTVTSARITLQGGVDVPVALLTKANDPNHILNNNQVFIVPTQALAENSSYQVTASGTSSGKSTAQNLNGEFTISFTFSTSTFTSN